MSIQQLQYPIGQFRREPEITPEHLEEAITVLSLFPEQLKMLVLNLSEDDLQKTYRPGGWTVRQLIHHLADSHHHSYSRFKWALTEENCDIKAYNEADWANLKDYATMPIVWSLQYIEVIHHKLTFLLKGLSKAEWEREFNHPEKDEPTSLKENALIYAWHSMHHYAHIKLALGQ